MQTQEAPWAKFLDQIPIDQEFFVPLRETVRRSGVASNMQLLRMEKQGVFPKRTKLNADRVDQKTAAAGHSNRELLAWTLWRLAARDAAHSAKAEQRVDARSAAA